MRMVKIIAALGALALVAATAPAVDAQGSGGQGQRGSTSQQGQRGQSGQSGQRGQMGAQGQGNTMAQQMSEQQRQRIKADQGQMQGVQSCTGSAASIQTRARSMAQSAGGQNPDMAQAKGQGEQISASVQSMLREHEQLMDGLSGEQQFWLRDQTADLTKTRDRIQDRLGDMNEALAASQPDAKRVSERAEKVAEEMEKWQKQSRQMGADMGIAVDPEAGKTP